MSKFSGALVWLSKLNKRLYKKPSFVVMLVIIALLSAVLNLLSAEESNVLTIAVYSREESTTLALKELTKEGSLIKYEFYETEQEAEEAVTRFGRDAAWIFDRDIEVAAEEFITMGMPMVRTVQQSDNVFLRISREKLFAAMYPYVSKALYSDFTQKNFDNADRELIDKLYQDNKGDRELIEVRYNNSDRKVGDVNYIVAPIRGLLTIAVFICAYSALMNFKSDKRKGVFANIRLERQIFVETASIFLAAANAAMVAMVAFVVGGLFTKPLQEIFGMLIYVAMCTAFCVILGELVDRINVLGALMPIIAMVMLVLCPVFINVKKLPLVQRMLPPFYYLRSFRNREFLMWGAVYVFAVMALCFVVRRVKAAMRKI